ncbi:NADH dehydrogenase [ubiquinone] 1 beta subcomplex subunit 3 [Teleopsis dalmanni]|uniref:NADH dehydrogenase [ubiquinone] 1 beta subcomplex subunit 3 n=1 Tax=Teleopsis dalmanni TaxID=139649 RepID=UPI0018CD290C|nr:NADH dehydrogenase [ubiquinone] 1 beta subcomplex subunit 3 [Teleopsis dalmanni]
MGGHGHGEPYKVPHPSVFKVENSWQLKQVQEALARQGLCDPWLRNEVWRYDEKQWGKGPGTRFGRLFFRGFIWGFAAFVVTIGAEYALGMNKGHGHGHGNGDEHSHEKKDDEQ